MWNQDLSLGIDISDQHVSAVLLSRHRDKISVVKTASRSLPASAFSDGGVRASQIIGRAIRQLLLRAGIRQKKAWVSFGSQGLLLQMVDLPEQLPANLGQYLCGQIRHSPLLNSKDPCLDFVAMTKNDSRDTQRCLVAAIDPQRIEALIKCLHFASLNPQVIDIPIMALCRALYKKQLSQGHKHHTLLFYVHGQDMYLAVLRKTNLDYVRHLGRISEIGQAAFEPWSMDQIRAVTQYYEIELGAKGEEELSWQFILASDTPSVGMEKLKGELEKSFSGSFISLRDENAMVWLSIEKNPKIDILPLSATGAALRKWNGSDLKTEIDLLPEQTRKTRIVVEYFISTSKIAAAVLLLILSLAYVLSARAGTIHNDSRKNSKATPQENIEQLLIEKKSLIEQLVKMNKQKQQVEAMMGGYSVGCMAKLLDQIRQRTPVAVCMTQLWSSREGTVGIEGYCPTMEDIQNYARLLETAAYVKTVHVRQSETYPQNPDVRCFAIICTLKDGI